MLEDYPFTTVIKNRLDKLNKDVTWLCAQIERSESWFWKIKSIRKVQVEDVEKIIGAIEFDLFVDWYEWKKFRGGQSELMVMEPSSPYKVKKNISIQVTITGEEDQVYNNIGTVLKCIKKEGDKHGFDII